MKFRSQEIIIQKIRVFYKLQLVLIDITLKN
jgi:hypothetical protein